MYAFTIPYFSLTEQPPLGDCAPLSPNGIFGVDAMDGKFIREEKFSLSRSGVSGVDKPFLMLVLNPLDQYMAIEQHGAAMWFRKDLFLISCKWEEVMDALDEQTTLPV